jgi:arylsulfatase
MHAEPFEFDAFKGKTGNGDWADMLAEMDANVGQMLDAVDREGVRDNTIIIFTSDNGSEFIRPWDGWAGPWRGQYFTALEGGIRVPFLIRWPGKITAGRDSNEIMHGVAMFATLAKFGGQKCPRTGHSTASISPTLYWARLRNRPAKDFRYFAPNDCKL